MNKIFSVGDLAKAGNTTPRAIRLYVDKGLLQPMLIGRTMGFPEDAVQTLEDILRAKRLGFSLNEIRACQNDNDSPVKKEAIKRIEALMTDARIEVADLRNRLAANSQRK